MITKDAQVRISKKEVVEIVLERALNLISEREHWGKGSMARNARGAPVPAYDQEAVCFCSVGAVERALWTLYGGKDHSPEAPGVDWYTARHNVMGQLEASITKTYSPVVWMFNDQPQTQHRHVVALFRRAIKALKKD